MRTMIAMSGGVDSSVAALLALDFSDEAAGCTLKLIESDVAGLENGCCSQESAEDARS
ncbi:MAG: tRNA 2-thiouridine(34) synthase MnmA, partial [Oscillospiraceae bacterium]|nr:tRNA 2-thiouridine(34) synthase MnmA [Oscillospiraceae bacterium]